MAEATTPKPRRTRGEGSIYKSKVDGRWHAAVVVDDPDTGARRRYVVSGRTMAIAKERLAELRRKLAATGRPSSKATLTEYLAIWLEAEQRRIRTTTWKSRALHVKNYIGPTLGRIALADLKPSDVERMTDTITAGGRSGLTARHARATLRRALADAERDSLVTRNVASLSRPPRVERKAIQVLSADETRQLIDGTKDDPDGPLFALAITTGLRQGELLGLCWTDVDGLDGRSPTLTVRHSYAQTATGWALTEAKTARSRRTLELGPTAVRALKRQRTRQKEAKIGAGDLWQDKDQRVFTDSLGRPLGGAEVTRRFQAALARLKLPKIRFHDIRHGVASMLLAQGVPLKLVSEQLGHSTIAITADTYSHLDREQRRASADAIERAIGSPSTKPATPSPPGAAGSG
jgi:integrase